jgi:hypothetical protein
LLSPLVFGQEQRGAPENSFWLNLAVTVLPFIIIVPLVVLALRWVGKAHMQPTFKHMEKHEQHMQRVEENLERIVRALEKRNDAPNQRAAGDGGTRTQFQCERLGPAAPEH